MASSMASMTSRPGAITAGRFGGNRGPAGNPETQRAAESASGKTTCHSSSAPGRVPVPPLFLEDAFFFFVFIGFGVVLTTRTMGHRRSGNAASAAADVYVSSPRTSDDSSSPSAGDDPFAAPPRPPRQLAALLRAVRSRSYSKRYPTPCNASRNFSVSAWRSASSQIDAHSAGVGNTTVRTR